MQMTLTDLREAHSRHLLAWYQRQMFDVATPEERKAIAAVMRRQIKAEIGMDMEAMSDEDFVAGIAGAEAASEDQAKMFSHVMEQIEANSEIHVIVGRPGEAGSA